MEEETTEKVSLSEYIEKYNPKPFNGKQIRSGIFIFVSLIGVIIGTCLFFVVTKLFELNEYAGYVGTVVALLLFVIVYVIPLCRVGDNKPFQIYVKTSNARTAKKYNKQLRHEIASKMIDIATKTDDITWYRDENIRNLALAKQAGDEKMLKDTLTTIYNTDVKNAANVLIRDASLQVGISTAISQSDYLDSAFISIYELNLIKQLVVLYGYRPTQLELIKIYKNVLFNAILSYGISNVGTNMASSIATKISSSLPLLGDLVGTLVNSASQGVINASLTVIIGFQTKKYLVKNYHLQDILDGVEFTEEDEQAEKAILNEISKKVSQADLKVKKENGGGK